MQCATDGWVGLLVSFACVLLWYVFSIGLTFYNKWLFRTYDLHFPLTVTTCHMVTNFLFAWLCRVILFRVTGRRRPVLSRWHYIKSAFPTGFAGALDIGLSNASLMYIGIALYTMCKSTSIVFLLVFAFCFGIEKPRWSLTAVILSIGVGIALFTYGGDTGFHLLGFLMVLTATVMAGLRWVLTQILLQKKSLGLHNPVDTLYHVTPVMAFVLMPLALGLEGPTFFSSTHMFLGSDASVMITMGVITAGAVLAFLMNFAEFMLISRTSSVTMSVAGIFKEVCTIALSVVLLGETMSALNVVGMVVTIGGIVLYNVIKFRQNFREAAQKDKEDQDYAKLREDEEEEEDEDEDEHLRKWAEAEEGESDAMRGESSGREYQARAYGSGGSEEGESYEMRPTFSIPAPQSTREHSAPASARVHTDAENAERSNNPHNRGEGEDTHADDFDLLLESTTSLPLSGLSMAERVPAPTKTTAEWNNNASVPPGGEAGSRPASRPPTAERATTPTTATIDINNSNSSTATITVGNGGTGERSNKTKNSNNNNSNSNSNDNNNNNNSNSNNSVRAAALGKEEEKGREEDQFAKLLASTRPSSRQVTNERAHTPITTTDPDASTSSMVTSASGGGSEGGAADFDVLLRSTMPLSRHGTGERAQVINPSPLGGGFSGTSGTSGSGGGTADLDKLLSSTMPLSRQSTAERVHMPTDHNNNQWGSGVSTDSESNTSGANRSGHHVDDDFAWPASRDEGVATRAKPRDSARVGTGVESSDLPSTAHAQEVVGSTGERRGDTGSNNDHHGHMVPQEVETFWDKSAYSPGPNSAAEGTAATAFFSSAGLPAHDTYDDDVYVEHASTGAADTPSDMHGDQQRPAWSTQAVATVPNDEEEEEDEDEETLFSGGISRQQSGGTGGATAAKGAQGRGDGGGVVAAAGDGWDDFDGEDIEF